MSAEVDISQQRAEESALFYREMGKRLQIAQEVLQLSDLEIANAMGASVKTYRKWRAGGRIGKWHAIGNLCDKLNLSYNWIYGSGGNLFRSRPQLVLVRAEI
jgi:transcriptional regulator with XRE-family HTH domain